MPRSEMPVEELHPTSSRSILSALIAGGVLLLALNVAACLLVNRFTPNQGYRDIRKKWEYLISLEEDVDMLIVGDSACNHGIQPALINRALEINSINLCTIGDALFLEDSWMLDYYLRKGFTLDALMISHVHDVWYREKNLAVIAQIPLAGFYWQSLSPSLESSLRDTAEILKHKYLPLYTQNSSLSHLLMYPWRASAYVPFQNFGFDSSAKPNTERVKKEMSELLEWVTTQPFRVSAINDRSLRRMLELAEEYDFDVYYVPSPMLDSLRENPAMQRYLFRLNDYLEEISSNYKRLDVLFNEPVGFPIEEMESPDHVIPSSAATFTTAVIERLNGQ